MNSFSVNQKLAAETIGTALLVTTVVGSGIMAANLANGNDAIALLGNTLPTGAILVVLISILGPISGAHFNPVVSLVLAMRKEITWRVCIQYVVCQIAGACFGSIVANLMFDLPPVQISTHLRGGTGQLLSEIVATFTLIGAIFGGIRFAPHAVAWLVGLTITAAYWFTASTSFANPAVALARMLSNTFAGIAPISVGPFIICEVLGALLGLLFWGWLFSPKGKL